MMGRSSMGSQLYGDRVKKMAKGGKVCPSCGSMGCACGGKVKKMAKGGKTSRGDGCCMKGKTKGRKV
jgi:hypothetical protein|tara:strand:- start:632 stop:832 length:201 start_codon:yes stop_codon:yes gene_type:complete